VQKDLESGGLKKNGERFGRSDGIALFSAMTEIQNEKQPRKKNLCDLPDLSLSLSLEGGAWIQIIQILDLQTRAI
jgi:hypothetical protein